MADPICYVCVIELASDASQDILVQKSVELRSMVASGLGSIKDGEDIQIAITDQGIVLYNFENGVSLIQALTVLYNKLKESNKFSDNGVIIAFDFSRIPKLLIKQNDDPEKICLASATAKAQKIVEIGESGQILLSDDFYQEVLVRSPFSNNAVYFGRYKNTNRDISVWGYFDKSNNLGSEIPPKNKKVEDEKGIPVYSPPHFKLKKPRPLSLERAQELMSREAKVLVLSPHPNDIPWGCAGTLMWMREQFNARIYLHFLTSSRAPHVVGDIHYGPAIRATGPVLWSYGILTDEDPMKLWKEMEREDFDSDDAIKRIMMKIPRIGDTPHQIYVEGSVFDPVFDKPPLPPGGMFLDGSMDKYPDILRDRFAWLQKQIAPDIVLCPSLKDIHMDHKVTADAAMMIFKFQESIWFYELPQASRNPFYYFSPNLFVDVSKYAKKKLDLLRSCFPHDIKRFHFSPDGAEALMATRAIEGYYERVKPNPKSEETVLPQVEAFEARLYF